MPTIPLRRLVDDDLWEAEDLAGRLGFVAHAAFLRAGFVPYGEGPSSGHLLKQVGEIGPSAPRLSCRYTAAQLARREGGASVDSAVLELRARGDGNVAFQAYLLTRDGDRRCLCEAVLDEATLAPLLAGSVADVARALETEEPSDASLWRSLVDSVFPVLLLDLCRRNDLPVTGFASLPDDIKAEILKRLTDGKVLARVECASKQMRDFVKERDGELWKAMYDSLGVPPEAQSSDSEGLGSWKERYMEARQRRRLWVSLFDSNHEDGGWFAQCMRQMDAELERLLASYHHDDDDDDDEYWFFPRRRQQEADLRRHLRVYESPSPRIHPLNIALAPMESTAFDALFLRNRFVPEDPLTLAPEPEVVARGKNGGKRHRKVQRSSYQKKRHGAGAIHSPSSRYKWKHR